MSLSKSFQKGQVPKPCEVCEVSLQIQWKCFDCKRYMCSNCKETIHPKFKHADKHKIVKTKDITSDDLKEEPDFTSISCAVHDDKLCCLYCKDCEDAICSLCVTQTHSKHNMIELSEGYDICMENLQLFFGQIDRRIKSLTVLEMIRYEDGERKMLMQEKELIKAIQSQTKILSKEFKKHWDNFKDTISEKEAACVETETKRSILKSALNAADANETFRVARKGKLLLDEEMTRITDIERPQSFLPRWISSTAIELVHGWLKVNHKKPVVAAIEIGTNKVGASVLFRHNYERYLSEQSIQPHSRVVNLENTVFPCRSLSCVLLLPNGTVDTIGYDALRNYEPDDKTTSFFERLGGILDDDKNELTNDTWLTESRNYAGCKLKKKKALDVFAAVISYIKGKTVNELVRHGEGKNICIEDIFWVLTIPNMKAEQFIRDAAQKANISNEEMTIIHETDALSEFCECIKQKLKGIEPQSQIGQPYLMFDLGDGTTDIILYEITGPRFVKEIYRGDGWKGNALVCGEVLSIFNQMFGQDVGIILKERNNIEYIDLISQIEFAIKRFELESTRKISVGIPWAFLQELTTEPLKEFVSHSSFNKNVTLVANKCRFTAPFFRSLFESAINYASGILDKCISAINKENLSEITTFFVVGDCLNSPIVDVIKQKFEPSTKVIVLNASTPVLDGALLCGFQ